MNDDGWMWSSDITVVEFSQNSQFLDLCNVSVIPALKKKYFAEKYCIHVLIPYEQYKMENIFHFQRSEKESLYELS